jgi:nucleotide-binding universal stress UspA family protein
MWLNALIALGCGENRTKEMTMTSASDSAHPFIVVGVDGSASSITALNWAARQAEFTGARLAAVTAWQWPGKYQWMRTPPDFDPAGDTQKSVDPIIDEVRSAHPSVSIESKVVEGHPARVLVEESQGAELLVVGSRGHGEFPGMLLGSVSQHCATSAHCAVVLLRA